MCGRKRESAVNVLQAFQREEPAECRLRAGLAAEQIASIEADLHTKIPKDLHELLAFTNGVDLFKGSTVIFGRRLTTANDVGDIADITKDYASKRLVTSGQIVFAERTTGAAAISRAAGDVTVTHFDDDGQKFASLAEWLRAEIDYWSDVREDEEGESE